MKKYIIDTKNIIKLSMPFSLIGLCFILLGTIYNKPNQSSIGFVWILIAAIAIIIRKIRIKNGKM